MEFLVISSTKLKIMLDKAEMKKYGFDCEELDYSQKEVRNSFWKILDIAAAECGFLCKDEKILIQFYPSKAGGEIFITKLGLLSKSAERTLASSGRVTMLTSEVKIYKFDSLSEIVNATYLNRSSLPDKVRAYSGDRGEYYLIFEERCGTVLASMSEFASEVPRELEAYIVERARKIQNPIENFEKLYTVGYQNAKKEE